MPGTAQETIWTRLRRHWLRTELEPWLAEDAGLLAAPQRRFLNPVVWLH